MSGRNQNVIARNTRALRDKHFDGIADIRRQHAGIYDTQNNRGAAILEHERTRVERIRVSSPNYLQKPTVSDCWQFFRGDIDDTCSKNLQNQLPENHGPL